MTKMVAGLVLGLLGSGCAFGYARVLPDACGSDKVRFETRKEKGGPGPADAPEGKARIVFIQTFKNNGARLFATSDFTTRFGVEGAWVGAAPDNSYFVVDVAPGKQHLCASVQNTSSAAKDMVAATSLTAEAGKTYFFEFIAERIGGSNQNFYRSGFGPLDEDEGKFRVKASSLSTSSIEK